jgi:ribosome-associated protein|tara:strand:- start:73 stop:507 length:435 start_codon:yes stop_codon:yes gene_type:complete
MPGTTIYISDSISLNSDEIEFSFIRASGPGGQNVNKVSSAVQLRFNAAGSVSLSNETKQRLLDLAGQRATRDGFIVIEAKRFRTQARNREDAIERLASLISQALHTDKPRRKSRPTRNSVQRRLTSKKKRGSTKEMRRGPRQED